jgi:hypothetical protein
MKLILKAVLMNIAVLLVIFSCATVPTKPLAPGELRLLSMHLPEDENIKVNIPFVVNIKFEADGEPEIRAACFYFSGDGPRCFKVTDVNYGSPGTIKLQIYAKDPGSTHLECYVGYIRDGKIQPTNVIGTHYSISPEKRPSEKRPSPPR